MRRQALQLNRHHQQLIDILLIARLIDAVNQGLLQKLAEPAEAGRFSACPVA